jgi:hypothetical protein
MMALMSSLLSTFFAYFQPLSHSVNFRYSVQRWNHSSTQIKIYLLQKSISFGSNSGKGLNQLAFSATISREKIQMLNLQRQKKASNSRSSICSIAAAKGSAQVFSVINAFAFFFSGALEFSSRRSTSRFQMRDFTLAILTVPKFSSL